MAVRELRLEPLAHALHEIIEPPERRRAAPAVADRHRLLAVAAVPAGWPQQAVVRSVVQPQLLDSSGRTYDIMQGATSIGRDSGNSVCLAGESSVSRRHAEITLDHNGAFIRDLGSSNGTRVNGVVIQAPTFLRPNDQIQLGAVKLTFRA